MVKEIKIDDVRELDKTNIFSKVDRLRKELFDIKISGTYTSIKKPHQIKILRKNIARLLTVNAMNKKRDIK